MTEANEISVIVLYHIVNDGARNLSRCTGCDSDSHRISLMQGTDGDCADTEIHILRLHSNLIHVDIVLCRADDGNLRRGGCLRTCLHIIVNEAHLDSCHTTDPLDVLHDILVLI